jgi:hypothetical protein
VHLFPSLIGNDWYKKCGVNSHYPMPPPLPHASTITPCLHQSNAFRLLGSSYLKQERGHTVLLGYRQGSGTLFSVGHFIRDKSGAGTDHSVMFKWFKTKQILHSVLSSISSCSSESLKHQSEDGRRQTAFLISHNTLTPTAINLTSSVWLVLCVSQMAPYIVYSF